MDRQHDQDGLWAAHGRCGGTHSDQVAVLSAVEAKKVNESYRIAIEADLKASEADPKKTESAKVFVRDWYRSELECVARVDELLAAIGKVAYFSPWVIVEEANID